MSLPAPPAIVSLPAAPDSELAPVLPVSRLASPLPVPDRPLLPSSTRFSTLVPSVQLTLLRTVSMPSEPSAVSSTTSSATSTM